MPEQPASSLCENISKAIVNEHDNRNGRSDHGRLNGHSRRNGRASINAVRIAYALVFVLNVQCALQFVLWPDAYAASFELSGVAGVVAIQGLGVAFLMWNATYPAFIASPRRFIPLGVVVLVQQVVGLTGELCIRLSLPVGHAALAASIERFIVFDAVGLALMGTAFAWLLFALQSQGDADSHRISSMK